MRVVFLLLIAVISGCSFTGGNRLNVFDEINSQADARKIIRKGMTMAEVRAKLGPPALTSVQGDASVWAYTKLTVPVNGKSILLGALGSTPLNTKGLSVRFNPAGRVARVDFHAVNQA